MDVSNASLYDGSTATAEAAYMAMRITGRREVLVADGVHPEYVEVMRTYARGPENVINTLPLENGRLTPAAITAAANAGTACVIVQSPNFLGLIEDMPALAEAAHAAGALFVAVVDPVSLAVLATPGDYGADIAVGDGQAIGNLPNFGGPHVGFMSCRSAHFRQLPGRIVGATVDSRGDRAYTLTLQTREQHIRREKATSNICTNQALCALAVTVYLALAGADGLTQVAETSAERAHDLAARIAALPGFALLHDGPFLHEFAVRGPVPAQILLTQLEEYGILGGVALERWFPDEPNAILIAVTEVNGPKALDAFFEALRTFAGAPGVALLSR